MNATRISSPHQRKTDSKLRTFVHCLSLVFFITFICIYGNGQEKDSSRGVQPGDTSNRDRMSGLRKQGEKAAKISQTKLKENQIAARQDHLFDEIEKVTEAEELYV